MLRVKYKSKPIATLKLNSENSNLLNTICQTIYKQAKSMGLRLKGPVSLPSVKLKLKVRRAPNGKGSGTYIGLNKKISYKLFQIYNSRFLNYIINNIESIPDVNMSLELQA
jgi:ribosomal protein S10